MHGETVKKQNGTVLLESYETRNCTVWTGVGVNIDGVLKESDNVKKQYG